MIEYVAGFLFDTSRNLVALIKKERGPAGMKGRLNGIGGHREKDESSEEAMIREFKEETGVYHPEWTHYCTLGNASFRVRFFKAFTTSQIELKTMTDEVVSWYDIDQVLSGYYSMMSNLKWLIPMALDNDVVNAIITDGVAQ